MLVLTKRCESGGTNPDGSSINKALDYVYFRDTAKMKQLHSIVSLKYLVKTGSLNKNLTAEEIVILHNAGIGIIAAFERSAATALKGRQQGIIDGTLAGGTAAILGYPQGLPIIVAVDTGITLSQVPIVRDYLLGFKDALNGKYHLGVYGGTVIIKAMMDVSVCNHVAGAKSWSSNPAYPGRGLPIHFVQHDPSWPGSTSQYDMNDIILPSQMWLPHDVVDPLPVPPNVKEDDMSNWLWEPAPARWHDTRSDGGKINDGETRAIPTDGRTGLVIDVGVVDQSAPGFVSIAGAQDTGNGATANWSGPNQSENVEIRRMTPGKVLYVTAHGSSCHVIIDLVASTTE